MNFSRRTFMKVAAISGATLAVDSGIKYADKLVPYVVPPGKMPPVTSHVIATTCRECPAGCGMHIRHIDGRITKAEGNPHHPVNRGGLCPRGQSALQGVYDPDRVRTVLARDKNGQFHPETWERAFGAIGSRLQSGGRVAVLSRLETGTPAGIMSAFARSFGSDRLLFQEAFDYAPLKRANQLLFGRDVIPYCHLDACDYIISFGADFLETWISNVQFAWQFAHMRELQNNRIGQFDYVGPRLSMTAANADNYVQVPPGAEKLVALAMLKIMVDGKRVRAGEALITPLVKGFDIRSVVPSLLAEKQLRAMTGRFANAKASAALGVPVGAAGPEADQLALIVTLLNIAAGRIGTVIDLSRPHALSKAADEEQFSRFINSLTPDDTLVIHKTNPAYTKAGSPEHLRKAGSIVYLGTMMDETALISDWILPLHDDLESWGEYEPWAGVQCLIQPTMRPLHASMDAGDCFMALAASAQKKLDPEAATAHDWLRNAWLSRFSPDPSLWEDSLRNGGAWPGFANPGRSTFPGVKAVSVPAPALAAKQELKHDEAQLWLWSSIMFFDGRTANRGWIQEAPDPVSTVAWDSWIDVHPAKARLLGIQDEDMIELSAGNRTVQAPARVTHEVAEGVAALSFGQGHTALGSLAANRGASAFMLLGAAVSGREMFGRVRIRKTGGRGELARAMSTREQHDRELLRWVDLEKARTMKPGPLVLPLPEAYTKETDLYPPHKHKGHRWAMAIDLQRCIGCGACAIACYAENNIAVVGKRRVREGRHLPWLRVVPYVKDRESPFRMAWLPMLCQHCDSAPCEPVCPVYASVNNEEGLNAQIYNRCIGTRYCSNNCPYKVRRFNWLNIKWQESLALQLNPEVTVRVRGVMEKCTFCIQRIKNAQHQAKRENRKVRDGEIVPACVQSCPAKVFTFGDLMDPESKVSKITRSHPRRYHVLEELNTKPAVTYLFRILQEDNNKT